MKTCAWIAALVVLCVGPQLAVADDAPAEEAPGEQTAKVDEQATAEPEGPSDEYYELMRVFVDTFEQIDRNYVKDVDRRELMEAALRGMLSKLDPYSDYISPGDLEHFTEAVEQEFGGIGIQVNWDAEKREIEVTTPLPGSPAYTAGIHAGDRIVEIEGKPVSEFPADRELQTAVQLLKGEAGVEVHIGIRHADSEAVEQLTLTRAVIQLDTVLGDTRNTDGTWNFMLDPEKKIGYIRLTHFTRRSAEEMRHALQTLKDQEMKALIIDLRYNPGGLLQSAVEIADMFVEEGVIVSTEGRNSRERSWYAKKFGTYSGFPMAVLVNRMSASASEILSACLQDYDRAVIVGERTWGKGSVQNVIELEGGDSALKLTTASYHRPSGKNIHRFPGAKESDEWGVSPDDGYAIAFSIPETELYFDFRKTRDVPREDAAPASDFVDTQLTKALDYLNGAMSAEEAQPAAEQPEQPAEQKPAA
ncbi:MAG: S41 family peptidase [Planctomycetaceae bacterium]|nr:S41 family peptidase [Planctomycetaceae bacterium]